MPIIIDCGGSTRVKLNRVNDVGDMPGLMTAPGHQHSVNGPFNTMKIVFQDSLGNGYTVPLNQLPTDFLVTSSLGQTVKGEFVGNTLRITLASTINGVVPLVRVEQHADAGMVERRRYNVTNAGAILTVLTNPNAVVVFDASNTAVYANGAVGVATYVSVVVGP